MCGVGCLTLGRLYNLILLIADSTVKIEHTISSGSAKGLHNTGLLHVGSQMYFLSLAGGFLFFVTANRGQVDSLVDDGSKQFFKYRLLSFILGPVIVLLFTLFSSDNVLFDSHYFNPVFLVLAFSTYYHIKHLIIPDVFGGFVKSLRAYNLTALIMELCYLMTTLFYNNEKYLVPFTVFSVLMGVATLIIPLAIERGYKSWKI